jgi:hypothetical protein
MRLSSSLILTAAAFNLGLPSAWARIEAININCLKSRISALHIVEVSGASSPDYCAVPEAQASADAQAVLAQALKLNLKATELFQLPLERLLPQPFELVIEKNGLGLMDSHVISSSSEANGTVTVLTMGVFSDWAGDPINEGAYEHELGHVIAENDDNSAMPPIYGELSSTMLVVETIADLSAMHATGHIVTPEPGLPACLQEFRKITLDQSYDAPANDFTAFRSWKLRMDCCQDLAATHSHTAHSLEFCQTYQKGRTRPPVPSFGDARFDKNFYLEKKDFVEAHQLGLPLNSFLAALQQETGLDVGQMLIVAMRDASSDAARRYTCSIPKLTSFLPARREAQHSLAQVLERLKARLSPQYGETFARLWDSHRMGVGTDISEIDSRVLAEGVAMQHGANAFNALSAKPSLIPMLKTSDCWHANKDRASMAAEPGWLDADLSGCNYVCRATR